MGGFAHSVNNYFNKEDIAHKNLSSTAEVREYYSGRNALGYLIVGSGLAFMGGALYRKGKEEENNSWDAPLKEELR